MSNPSINVKSGLDGFSQPRLATQAEIANFPQSLKGSEWKVQAITTGGKEILLSNATTMELVWFDYSSISPADRRSASATHSRKLKGGTLADDLVIARERQLGSVRSQPSTTAAAAAVAPVTQQFSMEAQQATAAAAPHSQLAPVAQQNTAPTAPAGPQTRSTTRADDRTSWDIQEIRGEQGDYFFGQYSPDRRGMPREPAQEWVHHTLVSNAVLHAWFQKKAGRLGQKTEAPPGVNYNPFAFRQAPVLATAGPSTAPVASAPEDDTEMEDYDDTQDAEGEEVPEWDHQWFEGAFRR